LRPAPPRPRRSRLEPGTPLTDEVTHLTEKGPEIAERVASGEIVTGLLVRRGWEAARVAQVEGALRAHAGQIIFGVIAGGEIAGPAGMFLSVPVIAALRIVWRRVRDAGSGAAVPSSPARS